MGCLCLSNVLGLGERKRRSLSVSFMVETLEDVEEKRTFDRDYGEIGGIVGIGAYGAVRMCYRRKGVKEFAVKVVKKEKILEKMKDSRVVSKQVQMFKGLNHPALLKIHDFYEDQEDYYIVMDYINAGDLFERVQARQKFCETCAARVIKQVFSGVAYLHSKGIVHRDIKLENLLIEENQDELLIKIIDFETCTKTNENGFCDRLGSLPYMAPEVIQGKYNEKCDVWSAGVALFVLITGQYPFVGSTKEDIERKILSEDFDRTALAGCSGEVLNLISKVLEKDPKKRFSAAEASRHGWILRNSYRFVGQPLSLSGYNPTSHALKLWALQSVIKDLDLVHFELAFMQADGNLDGYLDDKELAEYLKIVSLSEARVIISHGYWTCQSKLNFYEFISVMADKVFWDSHFPQILQDFPLNFPVCAGSLSTFLSSALPGENRTKHCQVPGLLAEQDFYTLITH